MASDIQGTSPPAPFWPGALRRRLEGEAVQVLRAAHALGDGADAPALADQLRDARAGLRRACSLGQADGGAARDVALAAIARASAALLGTLPSPQQVTAALAMHQGYAVECGFVGGRPLAVALCAILHVWSGRHCHIVGASDYLAARDAAAFAALYQACGCAVATLAVNTPPDDMARRYGHDIVYATGRQLLSDFLRDDLLLGGAVSAMRRRVQARTVAALDQRPVTRGMGVDIIDDIEAVLVDEAASPVLISAAGNSTVLNAATEAARDLVAQLEDGRDYQIERAPAWQVHLSDEGERRVEQIGAALPVYWQHPKRRFDLFSCALLARDVLERERHYVINDGRVMLADENVFRLLAGRIWHYGMLQAVEAREGLPLSAPPRTVARASLQTFFRRYERLAGAGSSFAGLARELHQCYRLPVLALGAAGRRPALQYGYPDRAAKLDGFIGVLERLSGAGGAVLVGAPRTSDLAAIGRLLSERGILFQVADGRDPAADALTLAAAGVPGKVTLMTGPAGRNGELPLLAPGQEQERTPMPHGLLFEHWESRRADLAFFAWADRAMVFASIEDDLLARALPAWALWLRAVVRADVLGNGPAQLLIRLAQWHGRRHGSRYRQSLALRETQLDEQLAFSKKG